MAPPARGPRKPGAVITAVRQLTAAVTGIAPPGQDPGAEPGK